MKFDVSVTMNIHVKASSESAAENYVLDMMNQHLAQMMDRPRVVGTSLLLSPTNPHAERIRKGDLA